MWAQRKKKEPQKVLFSVETFSHINCVSRMEERGGKERRKESPCEVFVLTMGTTNTSKEKQTTHVRRTPSGRNSYPCPRAKKLRESFSLSLPLRREKRDLPNCYFPSENLLVHVPTNRQLCCSIALGISYSIPAARDHKLFFPFRFNRAARNHHCHRD